jgi:hypothetical protein
MRRRACSRAGLLLTLAVVGGAALGTAVGSPAGPSDEWGCPSDRFATTVYTPAEGGGYETEDEALTAMVEFLVADGDRSRSEYAEAIGSKTGPTRYETETGRVFMDNKIEAQLRFAQLLDGTWATSELRLCGPPVRPEVASPYPTPAANEP